MNNYCVYMHISPSGKKYVGITCQDPNRRWKYGKGYVKNQYFTNAIEKYGWDNFQHIIVAKGLTEDEAKWLEIELIRVNDSANRKYGYNIDLGGTCPGKCSEETKRKMSEANKGKQLSEVTRQRIGEGHKGKHYHTEEWKQNHSEFMKGKNHPRAKSVICLTTKRIFLTSSEGANYYKTHNASITQCCKGKVKSSGKHNGQKLVWRYLNHKHNKKFRIKNY